MQHVDRVDSHPFACAVLPQVGREHERGYIKTNNVIPSGAEDPEVFISLAALDELAQFAGLPTSESYEALRAESDALREENERLRAENESLHEFEQAAEYSFKHFDRSIRKKPGRKPKQEVTA